MKNIIKQLVSEALVAEFYGKSVIEPITKRFNDSSDDTINKLGIAFLFKGFFGDIMQYKTKQDFDGVFDKWYNDTINGLIKTTSFIDNRSLAKKYLDAYIDNIVSLGDKAQPFSVKTVEKNLIDLVNNNRWIKDEEVVAGPTIYNPAQEDVLYEDDEIIILDTDTKAKCVRYGAGESWCITKPELNYYNTYRLSYGATPYFVLQKNVEGNEHKLVILNYGDNKYSIADRSNTGDRSGGESFSKPWSGIEREIPNLSGKQDYFKYRDITEDERKYAELLDKIKDEFKDDDLQGLIDSYANKLMINGSYVTSGDFIRDLAANQMYFSNNQLNSLNKESLDSLIEAGYFVNKYIDSRLFDEVLSPSQINRILKLKIDNKIVLDRDFLNMLSGDNLKKYLLNRIEAHNNNDTYYTSDSTKAKLTNNEIKLVKKYFPNQKLSASRYENRDEYDLLCLLLIDFDEIKNPETQKNLSKLTRYTLLELLGNNINFLPYFKKLDEYNKFTAWDFEELVKGNPKYYKVILNSIKNPTVKENVVRYLINSELYTNLLKDDFIKINNKDEFDRYTVSLVYNDKSKAFLYKPELLQYLDKSYYLKDILINQPTLFEYLGDKIELLDRFDISDIIIKNPKSLRYMPKDLIDSLKTGRILDILDKRPALTKAFVDKLDLYELRYLVKEKPVIIKYIPKSYLDKIDNWGIYQMIGRNKKAFGYIEPYLDEYRPEDKARILSYMD